MTVSSFVAAFKRLRLNQPVVSPVYDRYSLLAVMEGISHHGWEYYTEERRSENTALFYAVRYWKVFWLVSVMSRTLTIMPSWNCGTFVMNLLDRQTSPFLLCLPQAVSAYRIEGLDQVSKGHKEVAILLLAFFTYTRGGNSSVVSQVKRELNNFHWSKSVRYFLCSKYRLAYQLVRAE